MKKQLGTMALAAAALTLQACGGSMLGTSDAEDHKLVPEPMAGDEDRPRPSAGAPVLTSDGSQLIDASGEPLLLRGVNLSYGDAPLDRINGITSIGEVGANAIRIVLRRDTTADELETALLEVVEQNMVAIVSYWEPEVECASNDSALFGAINDLWLGEWLPVLVQDRFQPHIMLNLASKWGPDGIFNAHSRGYRVYIDNYKAIIGQMRNAGFNNPIVIDAPGCGQDYHAFLGNRGRELLAADDEDNIVLSIHGFGPEYRNGDRVASVMRMLEGERLPVVMSEFGDARLVDDSVRHMDILTKGAGDRALDLVIDWQTEDDKAAFVTTLVEPLDVQGRELSMEVYVGAEYVESVMGLQMYLRDGENRYANLGWNSADSLNADGWATLRRTVQDASSFGWAEDNFDLNSVTKIGLELVANGMSPELSGPIRIDNIKAIEASVPEMLGGWTFDDDLEGWHVPWTGTELVHEQQALGLIREAGNDQVIAESPAMDGVNFDGEVQVTARLFIPQSYADETEGFYFKFFNNGAAEWEQTNDLTQDQVVFGEWFDVSLAGDWTAGSRVGIQAGNLAGSREPLLVDDIQVMGLPEEEVALEWGIQYEADFSADTDGWAYLAWENVPATISAEEGALVILPRPSEVDRDPEVSADSAFAVQKNDLNAVEFFDLTSERVEMTLTIQLDEAYAQAPDDFQLYLFMQDSDWANHFNIAEWSVEDLAPGEWVTVTVEVKFPEDFNRSGTPQHFGFQGVNLYDMPDAPIRVSQFLIEGYIPLEVEEEIVALVDFHYSEHFDSMSVDFVDGGLVAEDLEAAIGEYERSKAFSWLAWSWIGNTGEREVLNLSYSEDTSLELTERGEEIVQGKGGLMETAEPASFPE